MPGTPIQLAADGAVNLHPDGDVILADAGEACCCGEASYVRALDCCDPRRGAWISVAARCVGSLAQPFWWPGQTARIFDGQRCRGVAPDAPVRTRERIEAEYPGEPILETDTVECGVACTDPRCPHCPECCTYGLMPAPCSVPPQPDECVHCGGSWRFELVVQAHVQTASSSIGGLVVVGSPPSGWRSPDCTHEGSLYYLTGWSQILPTHRRSFALRAVFEVTCDESGRHVSEVEYLEQHREETWDRTPLAPHPDTGSPPPLNAYTTQHQVLRDDTYAGWDHPLAILPREPGGPGWPGVAESRYCGFAPPDLPFATLGHEAVRDVSPPDVTPPCATAWSHGWRAVDPPILVPCIAVHVEHDATASMLAAAMYDRFGGEVDYRGDYRSGFSGSRYGTEVRESRYTAAWTVTPIVPCPPGLEPCGGVTPLPTTAQILMAFARAAAGVPRV